MQFGELMGDVIIDCIDGMVVFIRQFVLDKLLVVVKFVVFYVVIVVVVCVDWDEDIDDYEFDQSIMIIKFFFFRIGKKLLLLGCENCYNLYFNLIC